MKGTNDTGRERSTCDKEGRHIGNRDTRCPRQDQASDERQGEGRDEMEGSLGEEQWRSTSQCLGSLKSVRKT